MPAAPSKITGLKAALGPYYGIAKGSLEKKEDANYGMSLHFTCSLPPDLNIFSFSFINTVGACNKCQHSLMHSI